MASSTATAATTTTTTTAAPSQPPPPLSSSASDAGWWAAPPTFVAFAAQQRGETTAAASAAAAAAGAGAASATAPSPPPPPPTASPPPPTPSPSPLLAATAAGPRPRVAYQGVPGAYSEAAALAAFPGCDPVPCRTFEGAFQAAAQWSADAAVVPIENSLGGSIHAVYDLLLRYGDGLRIVGEVGVAVSHCLLAPKGTEIGELEEVTSHPQALAQCEGFIRSLAASSSSSGNGDKSSGKRKKIARVAAEDTAGSAAELSARWAAASGGGEGSEEGSPKRNTTAAIASARAAELYGLEILASDIQDAEASSNVTRFLVLAREPAAPRPSPGDARQHKASVVFSLPDGPGALFRALSVFALRDISMTKVESRPARDAPLLLEDGEETDEEEEEEEEVEESDLSSSSFDDDDDVSAADKKKSSRRRRRRFNYLFYLDVRANTADPLAQNALRHLREIAPFMRVLGCYPEMSGKPVGLPEVAEGSGGLRGGVMRGERVMSNASSSSPSLSNSLASSSSPQLVAYPGVPGAYSEGAALAAVPGCSPLPCEQFSDAFEALSSGRADRAVLPIENSLGGSIHAVYDLLLRHRLHVVGEASVKVDHCLMAPKGTRLQDVRRVSSHWQALAQVAGYLRSLNGGRVEPVVADDTAGAAKALSLGSGNGSGSEGGAEAAVASARAAELYGLEILARSIQDNPANVTRFLVLAREPALLPSSTKEKRSKKGEKKKKKEKSNFRASVAVALPDGPGALFKVLSVFALRDIDLTKIESRPLPVSVLEEMQRSGLVGSGGGGGGASGIGDGGDGNGSSALVAHRNQNASSSNPRGPFCYVFYVDVAANLAEEAPQNALRHLQEIAPFMRVLGCYPVADAAE